MEGLTGIILEGAGAHQIRVFKGSLWLLKCTLLGVINPKDSWYMRESGRIAALALMPKWGYCVLVLPSQS